MAEKFPHKEPGDPLSAKEVNDLNEAAKSIRPEIPGSYQSGISSVLGNSRTTGPPFTQWTFRITEKVETTDEPTLYKGHRLWYSHANGEWQITDAVFEADIDEDGEYDPDRSTAEKEWDIDGNGIDLELAVGDKVICYWHQQRGMFVPIFNHHIQYFELKDDIDPSTAPADAHPRYWNGDTGTWASDYEDDSVIVVNDVLGIYRGRKREKFPAPNEDGSIGRAIKNTTNNQWTIVEIQPTALWLWVTINVSFTKDDSTLTIQANPTIMFPVGALITDQNPAAVMNVYNPNDIWGSAGNNGEVRWNESSAHWEIIIAYSSVEVEPVTNVYCDNGDIVVCTTKLDLFSPSFKYNEECPP